MFMLRQAACRPLAEAALAHTLASCFAEGSVLPLASGEVGLRMHALSCE